MADSPLRRHPLDLLALTTGLLALAGSGLALGARAGWEVDGLVVLATLWIVLGLVGLGRVLQRVLRPEAGEPAP